MPIKWQVLGLVALKVLFFSELGLAQAEAVDKPEPEQKAGKTAKQTTFDIKEFRIDGNTLLNKVDVEKAVYPFLGSNKTINDVEAARQSLEQRYHNDGYPTVLVDIPQQDVQGGMVWLRINEGKIDRLRVTGSRYFSLDFIKSQVPALQEGHVLYVPGLQAQLGSISNYSPDRSITPVLRPGKTPGMVEVDLKVKDELPLHGSLELNNRSTEDTTRLRLSGSISYDNLWQRGHSLSLQYQTAPQETKEVRVFSGTYLARFPGASSMLAVYAVHSKSNTATLGNLTVIGSGDIYGVRLIAPLSNQDNYFHSISLGVDYKDLKESLEANKNPISYISFNAQYSATVMSPSGQTRLSIGPNFGIRGLGNTDQEFENKRVYSRPNYIYLRGNVSRLQSLYHGIDLFFKAQGQLSNGPLVNNEQFSVGGVDSARGYYESQALGDDGIAGSLEIHSSPLSKIPQEMYLLAFTDGAKVRIRDALPGQQGKFVLASYGVGMRMNDWRGLSIDFDLAWALKTVGQVKKGYGMAHFRVEYGF